MGKVYLLVGAPGSGKTWVANQLRSKFEVMDHDAYIDKNYVQALYEAASGNKPILAETPFSMSEIIDPLNRANIEVVPVFIIESEEVHTKRYNARSGKAIPKGHLTRTKTYLDRAIAGNHFYGTSEKVLKHLKQLDI